MAHHRQWVAILIKIKCNKQCDHSTHDCEILLNINFDLLADSISKFVLATKHDEEVDFSQQ